QRPKLSLRTMFVAPKRKPCRAISSDERRWPCHYLYDDGLITLSMQWGRSVCSANCDQRGRCASDVLRARFAWPRKSLRNEPNKNEHEPTNGRSIYYGSGRPIPASHGIERTFSWLLSFRRTLVSCLRSNTKLNDCLTCIFWTTTCIFWTAICVICALGWKSE